MATTRINVVISQSQGKNPAKRQLEEDLATQLMLKPNVDVSVVPHLYDMPADHTGLLHLRSVSGPLIVLSWMYPRAIRWILERQNVHGAEGITLLKAEDDPEAEEALDALDAAQPVNGDGHANRKMYCIDFRVSSNLEDYLEEIARIQEESSVRTVGLANFTLNGSANGNGSTNGHVNGSAPENELHRHDESPVKRRWYPVIDYNRCTNCMECIDFCLFGVYGIDQMGKLLVESQDSCKKGCPACSRVCPENAIMFPLHKSAAIAGADGEIAGLKIDLSKLFGGGDTGDALEAAVSERDAELVKDGREAVGMSVGIPKRQAGKADGPKDELDVLMDGLDDLGI